MNFDVIISGGGLVGSPMALKLAQAGLKVALVDIADPNIKLTEEFDGRAFAVSYGSFNILQQLGIAIDAKDYACVKEVRVAEQDSPWMVDYNHENICYVMESQHLKFALFNTLKTADLTWLHGQQILKVNVEPSYVQCTLKDQRQLEAKILIVAEGRNSHLRNMLGFTSWSWSYDEIALVATLRFSKPIAPNIAWEIFTPKGPLAILPMPEKYQGALIWSVPKKIAASLDVAREAQNVFRLYGDISLDSKLFTYPLNAVFCPNPVKEKVVLIGDAAHALHPIAGQGVNLGWRDVEALGNAIANAFSQKIDLNYALQKYQRQRRKDQFGLLFATHGIHRLFLSQIPGSKLIRNAGFALINNIEPLKKWIMNKARGV